MFYDCDSIILLIPIKINQKLRTSFIDFVLYENLKFHFFIYFYTILKKIKIAKPVFNIPRGKKLKGPIGN